MGYYKVTSYEIDIIRWWADFHSSAPVGGTVLGSIYDKLNSLREEAPTDWHDVMVFLTETDIPASILRENEQSYVDSCKTSELIAQKETITGIVDEWLCAQFGGLNDTAHSSLLTALTGAYENSRIWRKDNGVWEIRPIGGSDLAADVQSWLTSQHADFLVKLALFDKARAEWERANVPRRVMERTREAYAEAREKYIEKVTAKYAEYEEDPYKMFLDDEYRTLEEKIDKFTFAEYTDRYGYANGKKFMDFGSFIDYKQGEYASWNLAYRIEGFINDNGVTTPAFSEWKNKKGDRERTAALLCTAIKESPNEVVNALTEAVDNLEDNARHGAYLLAKEIRDNFKGTQGKTTKKADVERD